MVDATPQNTFRGLPLSPEQDAEVRHYIKQKKQHGAPWDTPELAAMIGDMLEPPGEDDEGSGSAADETEAATERAAASIDEAMDPIEASEERNAAMEAEAMKGPRRLPPDCACPGCLDSACVEHAQGQMHQRNQRDAPTPLQEALPAANVGTVPYRS